MPKIAYSVTRESEAQIRAKLLKQFESQKVKWGIKMKEAQTLQVEHMAPNPQNPISATDPAKEDWYIQKVNSPYKGKRLKAWPEPTITSRIREDGQEEWTLESEAGSEDDKKD